MADETEGGKTPNAGGSASKGSSGVAGKTAGRRARHSARKKEPVTIDAEPVKTSTARAKKAASSAAPAPAKTAPARPAPDKTAAAKTASVKTSATKAKSAATKPPSTAKGSDPKADASKPAAAAAGAQAAGAEASDIKASDRKSEPPKAEAKPADKPRTSVPSAGAKPADAKPATDGKPATVAKPATDAKTSSDRKPSTVAAATPPPKPSSAAKPDRKGVGAGGLIAAGIVGGALSLGGAWALGAFADDATDLDALRTQIDGRIAAVESSIPQAPDDALTRADVDTAIAAALAERAEAGQPVEPDPRIATLSDQLTATREELDALRASIAQAGEGASDGTALAALAARVADLDGRLASVPAGPAEADIQAIAERATAGQVATLNERIGAADNRVSAVEQALAPAQEQLARIDQRLTATSEAVGTIETTVADLRTTLDTRLAEVAQTSETRANELGTRLDEALAAVRSLNEEQASALSSQEQTLTQQGETLAAQGQTLASVQESVGALDTRMAAMAKQVADTDPERRAATALALANLRTRIDDGEAYETELALVRRTNPKIDLAPLDGTAGQGIATLAQLMDRFDGAAERIRAAVDPAPQQGAGGLLANLRSVVKVKPLDGTPGQDVDATIGAIRAALADRDLAAADAAWQSLPDAGREASADWHEALAARMKAKNFLSEALASLLEETGG